MVKANCSLCGGIYLTYPCRLLRNQRNYCSKKCGFSKKRRSDVVICLCGKKFFSPKSRPRKYCSKECFGIGNRDSNNYLWGGNKTGYRSKHHWVVRRLGKANHCVDCGLNKLPKGRVRFFHWANISGEYRRDITDYKSLCMKCHKRFDGYGISWWVLHLFIIKRWL